MFDKNLEFLNNDALRGRLRMLNIEQTSQNMSYCMTPSNDYLIMKDEIPIDDIENPRLAIKQMLSSTIKNPMGTNDIIITFGIGLGYLLDETFNTYPSRIFVYEPDLELLHFVLNNIDISDHLKSGRVFITNSLDDLIRKLSEMYITKDKVEVVFLKNYAIVKNQELIEMSQKVYETCRSKMIDVNTIAKFSKNWMYNTLKNMGHAADNNIYSISDLDGKFEGQTALILAPGPSLSENIEFIKANREKFVIFAVNKVLRYLESNGITPDFAVCLDAIYMDYTLSGLEDYLTKINCLMDVKSDSQILTKTFKKVFYTFSENDFIAKKIGEYNSFAKLREYGSSATTMALISAIHLGFNKIIFAGLDMAFKDDVMYATGEAITRMANNQIAIGSISKNIVHVPSVKGGMVATRDDYATALQHFETLVKDNDFSEIYNTTSFGAKIDGVKNAKLNEIPLYTTSTTTSIILGEAQPIKFNNKEWSENELMLINSVISSLSTGSFSPALVASIVKSSLLYEYMQADILEVLQAKYAPEIADAFVEKAKAAIKEVIDQLQKNRLI